MQNNITMDTPEQEYNNEKMRHVYNTMDDIKGKMYSNQTGKFPRTSSRGMKYVMIFYIYDANAIIGYPLRNKTSKEMLEAYQ